MKTGGKEKDMNCCSLVNSLEVRWDAAACGGRTIDSGGENLFDSIHNCKEKRCETFWERIPLRPERELMRMPNDIMVSKMFRSDECFHAYLALKHSPSGTMFRCVLFQFIFPSTETKTSGDENSADRCVLPGEGLLATFLFTFERFNIGMFRHVVPIEMKRRFEC